MTSGVIRGKVAITGIGSSNFGITYRREGDARSAEDLGAAALREALTDAGLHKSDIDGLCLARMPSRQSSGLMPGLVPGHLRHVSEYERTGGVAGNALQAAAMVIAGGMAETVACVYGTNDRSAGVDFAGCPGPCSPYEAVYGLASPGAMAALAFSRYVKDFDVPGDALAPLAVSSRKFARNNPLAALRDELSYEDYLAAQYIAEPLRRYDYGLINDGAVAVILTTPERAADLRQPPVLIEAMGTASSTSSPYQVRDDFWSSVVHAAGRFWADSGLLPSDMDVASFCDDFTPAVLFSLEAFGYCERGTGWEFVRDGRIEADGEIPLNTSGGDTSESHMQGWNHIAELARQVRGQSKNQVPGCELAHYACYWPVITTLVLARA